MNIFFVVLLVFVGVALLSVEFFLLPGFGVAGFFGIASLIGGIVLSYVLLTPIYPLAGHITLISSTVLFIILIIVFFKTKTIDKMGLDATIDSSVKLAEPGKKITDLNEEAEKISEGKKPKNG